MDGSAPETGWPFIDLKAHHSRILASLNPSGGHWVAVEISIPPQEDSPMELIYYNSMSHMTEEDPSIVAVTQTLPRLLYLASLRPGSPLAGFNPHTLIVEEALCPQQAGSWDCGPFSVYFLVKRLHNALIRRAGTSYFQRCDMGRWLRRGCAKVLHMNHVGDASISLKEMFAEPEPEPLEDDGDTDEETHPSGKVDPRLLVGTDNRPMIRFEIGAVSNSLRTIIIIIRWSGIAWFWKTYCLRVQAAGGKLDVGRFRTVVESLARERLAIYLEACGDGTAIEDLHIIVYAGTDIHTWSVPCSIKFDEAVGPFEEAVEPFEESVEPFQEAVEPFEEAVEKAAEPPSANGDQSLKCPIGSCKKKWLKEDRRTLNEMLKHLQTHMPSPIQSIDSEGKIIYRCPIESCKFKSSSANAMKRTTIHIGRIHSKHWLEEQLTKGLCIVPRNLEELLEAGSDLQCPYCECSYTGTHADFNLNQHMRKSHFREDNLPGWFTCEHVHEGDLGASWDELPRFVRERLVLSKSVCAHRTAAGEECPGGTANKRHYASHHGGSPWPFHVDEEIGICRARFSSPEGLQKHERMSHKTLVGKTRVGKNTSVPQAPRKRTGGSRAMPWTMAITADLHAACQQQSETQPVLLSAGLDGFTSHTGRLLTWLQQVDLTFTFAIVTNSIPTLDAQYFIQARSAYVSSYDSHSLRAALLVCSQAPAKYATLFAYWNRLQAMKDAQAALSKHRNDMQAHVS